MVHEYTDMVYGNDYLFPKVSIKCEILYCTFFQVERFENIEKKIQKGLVIINLCDGPEGIFAMPRNVLWPNKFALLCVMTQPTKTEMSHDPTLCPPALHTGYL